MVNQSVGGAQALALILAQTTFSTIYANHISSTATFTEFFMINTHAYPHMANTRATNEMVFVRDISFAH